MERKKAVIQWFMIVILLALATLLPVFFTQRVGTVHEYVMSSTDKNYVFQELGETGITQEFVPEYEDLEAVELVLVLLDSITEGNIRIQIEDPDGKIVCDKEFRPSDIVAGEFNLFSLNAPLCKGKVHRLHLSFDGTAEGEGSPSALIAHKEQNLRETGNMYLGTELSELNLAVTYHYR